jgi:arylsulfatase A-like enzyme
MRHHRILDRILAAIIVAFVIAAGAGEALAQPAPRAPACAAIRAACRQAGFVQGGATTGEGILVDCIAPIMRGVPQRRRASKPLPAVDPQLVAQCRAQNPNFGQRNAPPGPAMAPPAQTIAPPAPAIAPPAQPEPPAAAPHPTPWPVPAPAPAPAPAPRSESKRPNIVLVLTDDLSWNLVRYMPHVVKMQQEGMTFTNFFVTDSLCCPSRASIFTGRFPHNTGIFRNTGDDGGYMAFHDRGREHETFAVALAMAGYRTAMLGKYLNGYLPARHPPAPGWTAWAVAGNGYRGFDYNLNQDRKLVHHGSAPTDYMTDVLSGQATDFIKRSAGTPFAIEVATFAPHAPSTPAPRDADAFPDLRAPRTPAFDAAPDADAPRWLKAHGPLSEADIAGIDADFRKRAQSVLAVDAMIGELQAAVAAIGEESNTYFVFGSDNGFHMGEHRLKPGKMTAFDTDIRVPLIVTGPGIAAGTTADAIVENIDLCPTFAELGGAAAPANTDGRSLVPLLRGAKVADWRSVALIEHHGPVRDADDPDLPGIGSGNPTSYEAMRSATALYVEYADGETEYHDLASDPDELRNTFASLPSETQASLHATLAALQSCQGAQSCAAAEQAGRKVTQR